MTFAEQIRQAIKDSRQPLLTISTKAGVPYRDVTEFMASEAPLSLWAAHRICRTFGMTLTAPNFDQYAKQRRKKTN